MWFHATPGFRIRAIGPLFYVAVLISSMRYAPFHCIHTFELSKNAMETTYHQKRALFTRTIRPDGNRLSPHFSSSQVFRDIDNFLAGFTLVCHLKVELQSSFSFFIVNWHSKRCKTSPNIPCLHRYGELKIVIRCSDLHGVGKLAGE